MEAMICGYQYKSAWLNPVIEEELSCKREIGNAYDTHAVAVRNIIDEDIKTLGHVLCKISAPDICGSVFIRRVSSILHVYCQRESPTLLRFATA